MAKIIGTDSDNVLTGQLGNDLIEGNNGDDRLISRSDAGEPEIAQDPNAARVYRDQPYTKANDTLVGGEGADTFFFNPLINAKPEIIAKHVDQDTGDITWGMNGVAGENNNVHDHWVDSIGDDVIRDYQKDQGDRIQINGHTTEVEGIEYRDIDGDGTEESVIQLISNQGGAGAHDGDLLGTVTVFGDRVEKSDLIVEKTDDGALQFDDNLKSNRGDDTLYGDTGNDTLNSGADDDYLRGGSDDDLLLAKGGADQLVGDAGQDTLNGGGGQDTLNGGEGNDSLLGKNGDDLLEGGLEDDFLSGGRGNDTLNGEDGNDTLDGGAGDDELQGGSDDDLLLAKGGADQLVGDAGQDTLNGGGGQDTLNGGEGNDSLLGQSGDDLLEGGLEDDFLGGEGGNDTLNGEDGNDTLDGGNGNDFLLGENGDDLLEGGRGGDFLSGGRDNDTLNGEQGNDTLNGGMGSDQLSGGGGNDRLISRSDAGEPEIAQDPNASRVYSDQPFTNASDTLDGGQGRDTFRFELLLNAKPEIAAKHADPVTGEIDWQGVAGENDNVHDHWVDAIGDDVILDFKGRRGDTIEISGHTVEATISYVDENSNGDFDHSIIELVSNQGGAGAHEGDRLGTITVYGDLVQESDLTVNKGVFYGAFETIDEIIV